MEKARSLVKSPYLIDRTRSGLLVIDVQERLLPAIERHVEIVWNIRRLLDAARLFSVPILATEQYPQGLGPTVASLRERLRDVPVKAMFSCRECGDSFLAWQQDAVRQIIVVGIEAHVCVQQTVLDLLANGFDVFIPANAVGSRSAQDRERALQRMQSVGATITTAESVMFEWCETSAAPEFKALSKLVREQNPAEATEAE